MSGCIYKRDWVGGYAPCVCVGGVIKCKLSKMWLGNVLLELSNLSRGPPPFSIVMPYFLYVVPTMSEN